MKTLISDFGRFNVYDCGGYGLFIPETERWQPSWRGRLVSPRQFMAERAERTINIEREPSYQLLRPILKELSKTNTTITILDVDGFIGTFCIPIALCATQDGIDVQIHLNDLAEKVHVHGLAVSDVDGYGRYALRHDGSIGGQVFTVKNTDTQRIVPTSTLASVKRWLSISDRDAVVIKLDTQGHEPNIMSTSDDLTERAVWLIEFMHWTGRKPYGAGTFSAWISEKFYAFDVMDNRRPIDRTTMPLLLEKLEKTKTHTDLLLVPRV